MILRFLQSILYNHWHLEWTYKEHHCYPIERTTTFLSFFSNDIINLLIVKLAHLQTDLIYGGHEVTALPFFPVPYSLQLINKPCRICRIRQEQKDAFHATYAKTCFHNRPKNYCRYRHNNKIHKVDTDAFYRSEYRGKT